MRSIRRSLVLYVLGLMAVVMAIIGVLIDRVAARTLASRELASRQLIQLRYDDQIQDERERFDADLTAQARNVAQDVQMAYVLKGQADFEKFIVASRVAPLGSLAPGLSPFPVMAPVWIQIGFNRRVTEELARKHFARLHLDELPSVEQRSDADCIHVTVEAFPRPRVYATPSLAAESWQAPSASQIVSTRLIEETFETRSLGSGASIRVTTVKAPVSVLFRTPGGRLYTANLPGERRLQPRADREPLRNEFSPPPRDREMPRTEFPPPNRSENEPPPAIPFRTAYIQYGRPTISLEDRIAALQERMNDEIALESRKTARDRFGLRAWLSLIGCLGMLGLIAGGMSLVRHGLRPLVTLSEAVSKVSERDFRLPVERSELSAELVPIHDRLTETLGQLQRAFEHDKQAVADISHELRTPVAALLATIDVSLRKPRTAEQYRQTLEDSRGIAKQLGTLVERVMTLASLDARPQTLERTTIDAVELAAHLAAVIRPLAEAHNLSFTFDAPAPVLIATDADTLREVLMNLLHNAIEYNTPGGSIRLTVSARDAIVEFHVADTGIGMTDDVRSRIFERFYRADASRTATGIHAGLGLAIVKECVDRLGGRVIVESRPGEGSTFTVELPQS
jgi:signal transduction histidine kinase